MQQVFEPRSLAGDENHVGYRLHLCRHLVLCDRNWICDGVRSAGDKGDAEAMIETLALGLVTVGLIVYLVYALLRPEKF
jgi:K+-transporting ATPase KdpF subunit